MTCRDSGSGVQHGTGVLRFVSFWGVARESVSGPTRLFGAHTYERTDRPRGEFHHTNWTGEVGYREQQLQRVANFKLFRKFFLTYAQLVPVGKGHAARDLLALPADSTDEVPIGQPRRDLLWVPDGFS